jgi:hypothetical protein
MFTKNLRFFWTNIGSTMAWPNFKNGPKNELHPLGVKGHITLWWRRPLVKNSRRILTLDMDEKMTWLPKWQHFF